MATEAASSSKRMIISIRPMGNVGNRMIEYMFALTLGPASDEPIIYNCHLPEWGLFFNEEFHNHLLTNTSETIIVRDMDATSIADAVAIIRSSGKTFVVLEGFFQRIDLFNSPDFYRHSIFPFDPTEAIDFSDDEIVINVRAGEILTGVPWYPLVPVSFYISLIAATGLKPVFLGQLEDCAYMRQIKAAFPTARMIPSAGPMTDFNRVRKAKNICIAVSTFSWLAAWLSNARQIHFPLHGFLHPGRMSKGNHDLGGIDLAPADDLRYRFHLFPSIIGDAETPYLAFVDSITPISKEVPRSCVEVLKTRIPFIDPASSDRKFSFHETWYLKQHLDAAWEISEGWYRDARHHYTETGKLRGYLPFNVLSKPEFPNVALGKPATQSSLSEWSAFPTLEQEASAATNGMLDGHQSFHTSLEDNPWWRVDLGAAFLISEIRVFNRMENPTVAARASHLAIDIGMESTRLTEVYRRETEEPFGGIDGNPLVFKPTAPIYGRFTRIRLLRREYLHLDQVEIYGQAMYLT